MIVYLELHLLERCAERDAGVLLHGQEERALPAPPPLVQNFFVY